MISRTRFALFKRFGLLLLLLSPFSAAWAGQYFQDFSSAAVGATSFGDGSTFVTDTASVGRVVDATYKELQFTTNSVTFVKSALLLPDLDPGTAVYAWSAKWNAMISRPTSDAADGFSLSFGQLRSLNLLNGSVDGGYPTGIVFSVETWPGASPGFYVRLNGTNVAFAPYDSTAEWGLNNTTRHFFEVDWHATNGMTVRVDGTNVFTNVLLPGFVPRSADSFVLSARCGGLTELMTMDNITVVTRGNLVPIPLAAPYFTSSDNPPSETMDKAFDGNIGTKWLGLASSAYIGATCDTARTSRVYTVTSANDVPTRDPKTWTFEGSANNGGSWTPVGSGGGFFTNRFETRAWLVTSPASYGAYRLNISANNGTTLTQLSELKAYELRVLGSIIADLANIVPSPGTLSPPFASSITNYTDTVVNGVASITVTPTKSDINASLAIECNGSGLAPITSGTASSPFALNIGTNVIHIQVTAQQPGYVKDYYVSVIRPPGLPSATTLGALPTSPSDAMLRASINPNDIGASMWFEWGTTASYGNIAGSNVISGGTAAPMNFGLSGLTPGVTYHYRASVSNSVGVASTADRAFVAGVLNVTTLADGGEGSLRDAVTQTFSVVPVTFAVNGTIVLTNGELNISAPVTINGPGATNLIISGNQQSRVFEIGVGISASISGVTIRDGQSDGNGGGIYNTGSLTLTNCIICTNRAPNGADGFFPENGYSGGGMANIGNLLAIGCSILGNSAGNGGARNIGYGFGGTGGGGGGIVNSGSAEFINCTIAGNRSGGGGFGQGVDFGSLHTPGGPGADGVGGGIYDNVGQVTFTACTICSNYCGPNGGSAGGIYEDLGSAVLRSTIVAGNTAPGVPDIGGNFLSLGHNLIGATNGATGITNGLNADLAGNTNAPVDPRLAPLADYGGPTPTMAPLQGSVAISGGDDTLTGTDQRGRPRKVGVHVDIGAFEVDAGGLVAASLFTLPPTVGGADPGTLLSAVTFHGTFTAGTLNGSRYFQYGPASGYTGASTPIPYPFNALLASAGSSPISFAAGLAYTCRLALSNADGIFYGNDVAFSIPSPFPPGDLNGDGVVSLDEAGGVLSNFWNGQVTIMTNPVTAPGGAFQFGITNFPGWNLSVQASSDLVTWSNLTTATPFFKFIDPAATNGAPQRYYRLR